MILQGDSMNSNLKKVLALSFALTAWDIFSLSYRAESWSCSRLKDQLMAQAKDYFSGIYYLNRAVESGDLNAVKRWLAIGVNVNRREYIYPGYERTPLETAIKYTKKNKAAIVKLLIAAGANINKGSKEATPLYQAVTYENREAIKLLVQHGAKLLSKDEVLRLQYAGYETDQKKAATYGGALRELLDDKNLDKTIHQNIQNFLKEISKPDIDSLKVAIKYGTVNSVKSLLDVGLRLEDVDKETLMHPLSGCYHYNEKMVAFLIEQGFLLFSPAEVIKWRQGGNVKAPDRFTARDYIDTLKRMLKDKNTSQKARKYAQNFLKTLQEEEEKNLQKK